jgi:FkbM family methyltransferase
MTRRLVASGELAQEPLVVVDAGARAGIEAHWRHYEPALEVLALEADRQECERLARERPPGGPVRYVNAALGGRRERRRLLGAAYPDASSLLPPDPAFVGRFGVAPWFEPAGSSEVDVVDLDSLLGDEGRTRVDFLKLDVEGAELEVLEGAEATLAASVLGVSVEVWFQRERAGRPVFADVDSHLRARGFALFDLRELNRWVRAAHSGPDPADWVGRGQLVYAQALYLRDLPAAAPGPLAGARRAWLVLASLAEVLCYPDFGAEVVEAAHAHGLVAEAERGELLALLAAQATAPSGRSQRWARRAYRALLPAAARRRLTQRVQALLNE